MQEAGNACHDHGGTHNDCDEFYETAGAEDNKDSAHGDQDIDQHGELPARKASAFGEIGGCDAACDHGNAENNRYDCRQKRRDQDDNDAHCGRDEASGQDGAVYEFVSPQKKCLQDQSSPIDHKDPADQRTQAFHGMDRADHHNDAQDYIHGGRRHPVIENRLHRAGSLPFYGIDLVP